MKSERFALPLIIALSFAWSLSTHAQTKHPEANAEAGRDLALLACTGCHLVEPGQRFKPVYSGPPHPPDFKEIANRPDVTAASLQHHLENLPAVPKNSHMPNQVLSSRELQDVAAFILTLRGKSTTPVQ